MSFVLDAGHLARQRDFSERTFGPGPRTGGVLDHIRKELLEIEADPLDLGEWVDVVILALDGAWRAGYGPQEILDAIQGKQARNEARRWPDWRTADLGKAIEHEPDGGLMIMGAHGETMIRLRPEQIEKLKNLHERARPLPVLKPRPMRIWYDCEFVEDGRTIDLLSIGMVAEDGRTLYRVNSDPGALHHAVERDWLRQNVVKHLPVTVGEMNTWSFDRGHHDYDAIKERGDIRDDVRAFIADSMKVPGYDGVRLWAWYGAYDHVCYAQLFGRMVDLPEGFPMWTNDLKQEVDRLGNPELPATNQAEHNALADAQELRYRHLWLDGRAV